jgi:AsmA family/AsmA-like C-terminal region
VRVRLLPQPGFNLENFVVHDDPAFSAEPMLRAGEVTASVRLVSLLRGRLEISKLDLSEPSINLVRNGDGRWNLETLLERAARMPIAPTSKTKSERRPAFPYIQADRGRINLKLGVEKTPYALSDADFGLWQDSENSWGMRLKAQPVRTDLNLTDTGLLSVTGSWRRAATLRNTPVQFTLSWEHAQLGQATKLALGSDAGWRGNITVSATLSGVPGDLTLETSSSVRDFRRYDIAGGDPLVLAAQCSGHFSSVERRLSNIACVAPVGQGDVTLGGDIAGPTHPLSYDLTMLVHDVPMQALVDFARHAKKNIPDDLAAVGKLNANLDMRRDHLKSGWQGAGEALGCRLRSSYTKAELAVDRIPFLISSGVSHRLAATNRRASPTASASETYLEVGPFDVALGRTAPAVVHGSFSRSGYNLSILGDVQLQRLLQLARNIGVPSAQPSADGPARVDLQLAGNWHTFVLPQANGKIQLHSIRAEIRGFETPLEIESANLLLTQDQVSMQNVNAFIAGSSWRGSLVLPRQCGIPETCPIHFDLFADEISTDRLHQLFDPRSRQHPWYQWSPSPSGTSYALGLFATGKLSANRLLIHKLAGTHMSAGVELNHGKLVISDLRGTMLGGHHSGDWTADFTANPPIFAGSGTLQQVALEDLAGLMRDGWIAGTASASYHAKTSGTNLSQLLASATATVEVDARATLLPHITLDTASGPLQVNHFLGKLVLRDSDISFEESALETTAGTYRLNGTASLSQSLHLKLERDDSTGFDITGTVTEPRISPTTAHDAEAVLKP